MKKQYTNYHFFLFFSTLSRGIIQIFSLVILYQKGLTINQIYMFLLLTYLIGIIVSIITIKTNKKNNLIISNILYGISIIQLSQISIKPSSILLLAIISSYSNYSYNIIKHYYTLNILNTSIKENRIITINYIAIITSYLIGSTLLDNFSTYITSIIVLILSLISTIPILKYRKKEQVTKIKLIKLNKNKLIFSILEQFKIIFIELQPLFIYLYIKKTYTYIGVFNIIMNISSLIIINSLYKKNNHPKRIATILGIILFLKLNIKNNYLLLLIAVLEGIYIKLYEIISLKNLYSNTTKEINNYLLTEELIFLLSKVIIITITILLNLELNTALTIYIVGIILSGLYLKNNST